MNPLQWQHPLVVFVAVAFALVAAGAFWAAVLLFRKLRHERKQNKEDHERLEQLREQIVTTVSHELRTPLTIIQGLTNTLISGWDRLPESQRMDLIDNLGLNVASLDASVLHFLDAGRLERGEWQLRLQWVDASETVQRTLTKLEPVVAGHDIRTTFPDDKVWADEEALGRIVELLVVNACRFSPTATPINLRISRSGGGAEIVVTDRGQGIPARDIPHVFEPLWRGDVKDTGVSRGAGLGLAIVKELAERHGGNVTVTSIKGRGSTFRVQLPAASTVSPDN